MTEQPNYELLKGLVDGESPQGTRTSPAEVSISVPVKGGAESMDEIKAATNSGEQDNKKGRKTSTYGKISAYFAAAALILLGSVVGIYFNIKPIHVSSEGGYALGMLVLFVIYLFGIIALPGAILAMMAIFTNKDTSVLTVSAVTVHLLTISAIVLFVLRFILRF
jgi:hypothetical protein